MMVTRQSHGTDYECGLKFWRARLIRVQFTIAKNPVEHAVQLIHGGRFQDQFTNARCAWLQEQMAR